MKPILGFYMGYSPAFNGKNYHSKKCFRQLKSPQLKSQNH